MRLKSIKLAGFKSFVDPTTVTFPSNLCSVVGPNGCGKSNIIDAVRWVMGESSAKNLRGESMTDVIFNGSGGRKPVGQASIELIFDNSDSTITGEYAGFNEISIKRKVTRESQNIYYLNGVKCRRRDITDIFLGTGLGPRSYAIIEQGMISKLIEAKPEELRVYIEEAAGISKYKERRRDTENRIRRTYENLERLTDIRDELERQLQRLQRQAQAAEKYTDFKKEERELKADLQAIRYQKLKAQADQKQQTINELELSVEASVTEQVRLDTLIEKKRTDYTDTSDKFNEVQGRFYAIGTEVAKLEQSIAHAKDRERQIKVDLDQTERDCRDAREHLESDNMKSEGLSAELLEIEPELEDIALNEELSASTLLESEENMQLWQQKWDSFNQDAAAPRQQAEVQQSRIKYLEQVQQRLYERIKKLEQERDGLVLGDSEEDIALLEETLGETDLQIEEAVEQAHSVNKSCSTLKEQIQRANENRDQKRAQYQSAKGRLASLETLHQAAMGDANSASSKWLTANKLDHLPRLAENIHVDQGYEKAVEAVLESSLQAVCLENNDSPWSDLISSMQTQLNFVEPCHIPQPASEGDTLRSKVQSSHIPEHLLHGIYVCDDLNTALSMRKTLHNHESVVTKDGLWLSPNWLRVVKGSKDNQSIIARKQELDTLTLKVADLEEQIADDSDNIDTLKASLTEKEHAQSMLRKQSDQLQRQFAELSSQLSTKRAKVEQVIERRARVDNDIVDVREQLEREQESLAQDRLILQDAINAMEADTEQREVLVVERDTIRSQLENARQSARSDKDRSHQLQMRVQSIKAQLDAIKLGVSRLEEQSARMQERRELLLEQLEESIDPTQENALELEALLEKRISVEHELSKARQNVDETETALRSAEQSRQKIEQQVTVLRTQLEGARLEAKTYVVQSDNLRQQLIDEQFDLDTVLSQLDDALTEDFIEQELEKLATRISRLGAINLAAIDEYKVESERKNYLDAQNDDLMEALETLENAIKKIDKETRTRFKETFDQVNSGIQELFPKVFGGGHAYLELTGDDMLDTGIAIMARPPGKKNSTIHLLSGGEKALTAIALVFSIFRLNPAPFCMLDEVDAPLDDANVGRYARMVEEMSSKVQFIYITHNKIAMEMAHQLLGVTMHEPGVSRLVTVDVDEAAELAAS